KLQLNLRKDILKLNEQITAKNEGLAGAKKRYETFLNTYGEQLKTHEAIRGFSTDIEAYDQQRKQIREQEKEIVKLETQQNQQQKAQNEKKREIGEFVGTHLGGKDPLAVLNVFFEKVSELQRKRETLMTQYREKNGLFHRELEGVTD